MPWWAPGAEDVRPSLGVSRASRQERELRSPVAQVQTLALWLTNYVLLATLLSLPACFRICKLERLTVLSL